MEFAERGNLNDLLKQQQKPIGKKKNFMIIFIEIKIYLDWITRMKWSLQLSNALIFLHEKKIIHRDLRCSNILVTKDLDVKISGLLKFCLLI